MEVSAVLSVNNNSHLTDRSTYNVAETNKTVTCEGSNLTHVLLVTVYIIIAVCGSVGNILSFVVLHWKSCRNATNILLKGLSVIDTIFLFCAILRVAFVESSVTKKCDSLAEVILGNLAVRYIMTIAQFISVWVIVVLAFFRYMAICKPFNVTQWCNRQTAQRSFLVISVVGLITWAPYMSHYYVTTKDVTLKENVTWSCYVVAERSWTKHKVYRLYDGAFAHIGSMFIIPFIALLVFNTGMMRELYCQHAKSRDHLRLPKRTKEVMEITKVVIAIVIVFVLSYSMYFLYILHLYTSLTNDLFTRDCSAKDVFMFTIRTVALLNSSVNFIIYYILRKSFRRKVWLLLCACTGDGFASSVKSSRVASRYGTTPASSYKYKRRYTAANETRSQRPKLEHDQHKSVTL